jgi:hypothetical protein
MMTMDNLKTEYLRQQASEASKRWQEYLGLLGRIIEGQAVAPDLLAQVLGAVGRCIDDVRSDCENVKQRRAIRKRAADAEVAKPKLREAQAALDALKKQKQDFLDEIIPRIEIAVQERDYLSRVVNGGDRVMAELIASCRDPGLAMELDAIDTELCTLSQQERDWVAADLQSGLGIYSVPLAELQDKRDELTRRRDAVNARMVTQ